VVPLVRPVTTTDVAGGEPVTVLEVCAVVPMKGVTVYCEMVAPPLGGAVQETVAVVLPPMADTPVGVEGA